jgi:signal transduction histidine kinase
LNDIIQLLVKPHGKSLTEPQEGNPGDAEKNMSKARRKDSTGLIAGGIAHDLNTILTLIYGYSELALEGLDPSGENFANIKKIIQSADRAKAITGQLLSLGMEADQARMRVPVKDVLRETLEFLRPLVTDRIIFSEQMLTPEVNVSADPIQLYRVFINLARNAIHAMEERGGTLTVTLDTRKGAEVSNLAAGNKTASEYALIRFADTGPGMDETTAARMFEPFFTAGKQGMGTGLGLSVVYGIISAIDGEISVTTKEGRGTVIELLIPSLC